MKQSAKLLTLILSLLLVIQVPAAVLADSSGMLGSSTTVPAISLDGQASASSEEIYPGITASEYYLSEGSKYGGNGPQFLRVIEFDPSRSDLGFDVVPAGEHINDKAVVTDIVDQFNKTNTENKTVIAAVNGDLWMMAQYHSRVEGLSDDPVVKKELCLPRGYVVSDGEIICSQNMQQETPFEERFQSFGITDDGTPYLGDINTRLFVTNNTQGTSKKVVNGLNRLPANGTLVVYSDKGPVSSYALDDAYEVVVDCDYDYKIFPGETITGTVTAISKPGEQRYSMQPNRLIFSARGTDALKARISGWNIGDEISMTVDIKDLYGNTDAWRTIKEAVGGHVPVLIDGKDNTGNVNTLLDRADPMTLIGFKEDGTVMMIVNDGRQTGYSIGINRSLFDELCLDLGLKTAFLLDGGGSTTLVELAENGYELKNRPSDYYPDGVTQGNPRAVVNAVLLSYISEKPTISAGDVNCDGKTDNFDLIILKRYIIGKVELTEEGKAVADVRADGRINILDVIKIKRFILGLGTLD